MLKEKLYAIFPSQWPRWLTLAALSTAVEGLAFLLLAGAFATLALRGLAVAAGMVAFFSAGPLLTACLGLFMSFLALFVLSILIDGTHRYRQFAKEMRPDDDEDEPQSRTRRV